MTETKPSETMITLSDDIEGVGKVGDQVSVLDLMRWGAEEGRRLGYLSEQRTHTSKASDMTIRFIIEYDLDSEDWNASGVGDEPYPKELHARFPYIIATILRDCVAPKGTVVDVKPGKVP